VSARILTALVSLPFLLAIILGTTSLQFRAFIFAITVLSLFEYFRMALRTWQKRCFGIVLGLLIAAAVFFENPIFLSLSIAVVLLGTFGFFLFNFDSVESSGRDVCVTVLGVFYSGFLPPHLSLLRELSEGIYWLLFFLIPVFVADSAAFFVGRHWGKKPLHLLVSSAKTVEGALASLLAGAVTGTSVGAAMFPSRGLGEIVLVSVVVNLLAQVGDLAESLLKRSFQVKDSGGFFPGHGGVLDRTDSLLFPGAFVYYYCVLRR
jgi:phosphatidate cytidylyltransferase